jgi:hypothetical protein
MASYRGLNIVIALMRIVERSAGHGQRAFKSEGIVARRDDGQQMLLAELFTFLQTA